MGTFEIAPQATGVRSRFCATGVGLEFPPAPAFALVGPGAD